MYMFVENRSTERVMQYYMNQCTAIFPPQSIQVECNQNEARRAKWFDPFLV